MAEDRKYDEKLVNRIRDLFTHRIDTQNFINLIHRHDESVLSVSDIDRLKKKLETYIDLDVNTDLLHVMMRYPGWFKCILTVCRDPEMRMEWLASEFQKLKQSLDEKLARTGDETEVKQVTSLTTYGNHRNAHDGDKGLEASDGAGYVEPNDGMNLMGIESLGNDEFRCTICKKDRLKSKQQRDDHIKGKKHMSELQKLTQGSVPTVGQSNGATANMKPKNDAAVLNPGDKKFPVRSDKTKPGAQKEQKQKLTQGSDPTVGQSKGATANMEPKNDAAVLNPGDKKFPAKSAKKKPGAQKEQKQKLTQGSDPTVGQSSGATASMEPKNDAAVLNPGPGDKKFPDKSAKKKPGAQKEQKQAEQVVLPVSPGGGRDQNDGNRVQKAARGARVKMNSSPIIPLDNGYYRCIPCDKNTLNSEKQRDDHIQNDKHKSKLNKWIPGTDPPQFKQCDDPRNAGQSSDASADMKSKNVAAAVTITDKNNIHNYGECTLCGVKYQSPEKALEHLKGKPHAKKVAAQK